MMMGGLPVPTTMTMEMKRPQPLRLPELLSYQSDLKTTLLSVAAPSPTSTSASTSIWIRGFAIAVLQEGGAGKAKVELTR